MTAFTQLAQAARPAREALGYVAEGSIPVDGTVQSTITALDAALAAAQAVAEPVAANYWTWESHHETLDEGAKWHRKFDNEPPDPKYTHDPIRGLTALFTSPEVASKGVLDVLAERHRQVSAEGWTAEHDDEHTDGSMAKAAACYALHTEPAGNVGDYLRFWPWDSEWWKPKDRRRNLVRAGALILAELERIDRNPTGNRCSDCGAFFGKTHNYGCMYDELDV